MQTRIRCLLMRGGTSKGAYFLTQDLPQDAELRDQVLLAIMGSPDVRQIDGIGGGNSLTSKVAIVQCSLREDADLDYLFAQVNVDQAKVDYGQNCGNILAGVVPFAIERGLIKTKEAITTVRVFMQNTEQLAYVSIQTPDAKLDYVGETYIDGVREPAAEIILEFTNIAGSTCGQLLPTGQVKDEIDGINVTCIDNGMPVVLIQAQDLGCHGNETPQELDQNHVLKEKLEKIRLKAGHIMNLGDVTEKTVPKMCLISSAQAGGMINTRSFIPHQCHSAIGVFGATSVATACILPESVASSIVQSINQAEQRLDVEHPSGHFTVLLKKDQSGLVTGCGFVRTARALFDGWVLIPSQIWKN
ncbi:4-oxalomesaconate tautomerase [uncultured Acinetobacter sp.]|uniref:4-oxalomesaconate tautomerase n=1 Tax=uncultured Acinetobacter sp. TaxID=165433 RepID=UPI00258870E5|nr:4-oxalomesaconate tautomerase [uncultured Acinetobacter sp.]